MRDGGRGGFGGYSGHREDIVDDLYHWLVQLSTAIDRIMRGCARIPNVQAEDRPCQSISH